MSSLAGRSQLISRKYHSSSLLFRAVESRNSWMIVLVMATILVASIECDKVGSANVIDNESSAKKSTQTEISEDSSSNGDNQQTQETDSGATTSSQQQSIVTKHLNSIDSGHNAINSAMSKLDPLAMLREIYHDHSSKTVNILSPGEGDQDDQTVQSASLINTQLKRSVQKFHPNGRYGRRSVDNFGPESHSELGKLVYDYENTDNDQQQPLKSLLHDYSLDYKLNRALNKLAASSMTNNQQLQHPYNDAKPAVYPSSRSIKGTNYEMELKKLLNCNYTGMSNLYRCNNNAPTNTYNME